MMSFDRSARIWLILGRTDMRKATNGLKYGQSLWMRNRALFPIMQPLH